MLEMGSWCGMTTNRPHIHVQWMLMEWMDGVSLIYWIAPPSYLIQLLPIGHDFIV